jgi:type VI secretion system secreted protein Hcp
MRKSGGNPLDYLRITMNDVIVTGVQMETDVEQIKLSFGRVKQEYILQNTLGGSAGVVTGIFDVKENTLGR